MHIMFTEHSITHLLQLPALSFPRVIINIFQLRSFQIIILQTFLIAIIINNNIGKYLLTRQNIKKRKKLLIFGQEALFQNWSYSKTHIIVVRDQCTRFST
jgi:hypothetical protein